MARKDLYIDESGDREIVPRMYFSSQQHADLRLRKCIVVQCYWRGYKARCRGWSLRGKREGDGGGKGVVGREKEPDKRSKESASPEVGTKVERRSINAPVV